LWGNKDMKHYRLKTDLQKKKIGHIMIEKSKTQKRWWKKRKKDGGTDR